MYQPCFNELSFCEIWRPQFHLQKAVRLSIKWRKKKTLNISLLNLLWILFKACKESHDIIAATFACPPPHPPITNKWKHCLCHNSALPWMTLQIIFPWFRDCKVIINTYKIHAIILIQCYSSSFLVMLIALLSFTHPFHYQGQHLLWFLFFCLYLGLLLFASLKS